MSQGSKKKRNGSGLKDEEILNVTQWIKNTSFWILWGDDYTQYNTVIHTTLVPFWLMQLFRMFMFLILLCISAAYFYIYVKATLAYFQSFALLFTTLAFYFLFIGSGKQKCYQTKVANKEKYGIDYSDESKKENQWMFGVFFYGQAFPLALIASFMFFIPYRRLFSDISPTNY